ncbi:MAG: PorP/SprF family type IX secretion system membrane protein [Bacteroidia bacterium]|nr:PorP/SprF family type IX secretion system membrane protein [Bacteroidia bacterium]MDW8346383.1 PorP/SprF family type IX secretion system membrane protein [Bacteroidia bacterium]
MKNVLTCFICVIFLNSFAQDPQFSQFYAAKLYMNPAFAGSGVGPRATLIYRNQWPGLGKSYNTFSAAYDQTLLFGSSYKGGKRVNKVLTHGVGAIINVDKAGEGNLESLDFNAIYSANFRLGGSNLLIGGQAGFAQKSIDFYLLTFGNQIDPRTGFNSSLPSGENLPASRTITYTDFAGGIEWYNKYLYAGISAHHLTQPNQSLLLYGQNAQLPMRVTGNIGGLLPVNEKTNIGFGGLYRRQGPFTQIDLGIYGNYQMLLLGTWYRLNDAVILLAGVKLGMFTIGYSYDITTSNMRGYGLGAHEISLNVEIEQTSKLKGRRFRKVPCPRF